MTDINEVHWYCPSPAPATHIVRITSVYDLEAGVHHVHHVVVQSEAADDNLGKHAATLAGVIARNWLEGHMGGDTATWKILTVRAICPGIVGVNTRSIPDLRGSRTEFGGSRPLQISWVLVEGEIGDYAVYCGCGEPDDIKRHGNKVSFREACDHFPSGLIDGLYRR